MLKFGFLLGFAMITAFGHSDVASASDQNFGPFTVHVETADGQPVVGAGYRIEFSGEHNRLRMCPIGHIAAYPCMAWDQDMVFSQNIVTDSNGNLTIPVMTAQVNDPNWESYELHVFSRGSIIVPQCSKTRQTGFNTDWENPATGMMAGVLGEADQVIDAAGMRELANQPLSETVRLNTTAAQFAAVVAAAAPSCESPNQ